MELEKPLTKMVREVTKVEPDGTNWRCHCCGEETKANNPMWGNDEPFFNLCEDCYQMTHGENKVQQHKKKSDPTYYAVKVIKVNNNAQLKKLTELNFYMKTNICPRIVTCHFVHFSNDLRLFICLDYYPFTLDKFLQVPENRNNPKIVKKIMLHCCEGLQFLKS